MELSCLFNFGSYVNCASTSQPCLQTFWILTSLHNLSFLFKMFFIILVYLCKYLSLFLFLSIYLSFCLSSIYLFKLLYLLIYLSPENGILASRIEILTRYQDDFVKKCGK